MLHVWRLIREIIGWFSVLVTFAMFALAAYPWRDDDEASVSVEWMRMRRENENQKSLAEVDTGANQ